MRCGVGFMSRVLREIWRLMRSCCVALASPRLDCMSCLAWCRYRWCVTIAASRCVPANSGSGREPAMDLAQHLMQGAPPASTH
ncbi:hypothetical protein F4801DRAFT_89794 [Xylaria longipes]|nr:hypothetical protein F4801DRAFT_89794 [Xylaria longipes]